MKVIVSDDIVTGLPVYLTPEGFWNFQPGEALLLENEADAPSIIGANNCRVIDISEAHLQTDLRGNGSSFTFDCGFGKSAKFFG